MEKSFSNSGKLVSRSLDLLLQISTARINNLVLRTQQCYFSVH